MREPKEWMDRTCDVCGDEWYGPDDEECTRCAKAKAALSKCGQDAYDVMSWVQAVAKKAAESIVISVRTPGAET